MSAKFVFDTSIPQQPDFGRSSSEDVLLFIQQHRHMLGGDAEPAADANKNYGVSTSLVQPTGVLTEGIIKYALPGYGGYRVALFGLGGVIRARNGMNAYEGTSDVSVLPIGTHVIVAANPSTSLGTIIGIKPMIQGEAADAFCDFVVQGSGVGLYCSPHYLDYLSRTADAAAALPYAGDRPLDGLPGDWTVMSPTGVGLHADTEMAYIRTSELCGLFLFREDGHARLSGESLAMESLSVREESGVTAYETYAETQQAFYPWEAVGYANPGGMTLQTFEQEAVYAGTTAKTEPTSLDAIPIARLTTYGGYLGQGELTILSTPTGDTENRLSNPTESRGLFREQVMLDGTYLLESARQMFFVKATDIPVLHRNASRDYLAEGETYRSSGTGIEGDEHIVSQLHSGDPLADATGLSDLYAYASAWQGLHAAVYNPNVEVKYPTAASSFSPSLEGTDRITPPSPEKVRIDHRYNEVDIYRVLSLFAFLPDGTVVLRDGLGAELRMSGGVVELSGTGVYVNAAKTVSVLAGQVALRAQQDIEVVSSLASVRIKAERNVMVMGGHSGIGGVLIESRSVGYDSQWPAEVGEASIAGVMIKSTQSAVGIYGGEVLLQTGPTDAGSLNGRIIIDSPQNSIILRSVTQHSYSQGYYDHFGDHPDRVARTNYRAPGLTLISGSLSVSEQIVGGGSMQIRDNYTTEKGHYASTLSQDYQGLVGIEKQPGLIAKTLKRSETDLQEAKKAGQEALDNYRDTLRAENRPGNPETIRAATFGFPSSEAYGASNVTLVQPYWQQLLPSGTSWREPIVKYRGNDSTRPWPGHSRWEDPAGYKEVDGESVYFDKLRQRPIDPTENRETYEQITPPTIRNVSIQSGLKTVFIS